MQITGEAGGSGDGWWVCAMEPQTNSGDFGLQVVGDLVNQSLGKLYSPGVVLTNRNLM